MALRIIVLYAAVIGLLVYAWKDWFKSLCGLILLMAILEYEDVPKAMFGINGLNIWNVLFGVILLAWVANRRREGLRWDLPGHVVLVLAAYLGVIFVGVLRAVFDQTHLEDYLFGTRGIIIEELINTVKWILPGLLLFDGCRNRSRVVMALACLLLMYFAISLEVARAMPPQAALGSGGSAMDHARLKLNERVGYAATDLSVMLAGACWGTLASLGLVRGKLRRFAVLAGAGVIAYGQALTGGRGGYIAWGMTGLVLCLVKWRRYLVLTPVVVLLLPVVFPGAAARMLEGFGQTDVTGQATVDQEAATSGRTLIWPYVIAEIGKAPWIGHGKLAMKRTGLFDRIETEYPGTGAPHPHNMYLETLLDNGVLGSLPIWLFWAIMVIYSARLFRSDNRLYSALGGLALALVLSSLIGGIAGQHFYPQEHTLGVWVAVFLMLRIHVEETRVESLAMYDMSSSSCPSEPDPCATAV
jgi:O-antigen ligase